VTPWLYSQSYGHRSMSAGYWSSGARSTP
jgi:hypothetical protein